MKSVSVDQFRGGLNPFVNQAAANHEPLKVTRIEGGDYVVISAEYWKRDQEVLYVL